jgi:hypothetical protein
VKQVTLRLSSHDLELIQDGLQLLINRETGQRGDRWYGWLLNVALRIARAYDQTGRFEPLDLTTAAWPAKILPKAFAALDREPDLQQKIRHMDAEIKALRKKPATPKPKARAKPRPKQLPLKATSASSPPGSPYPHNIPPQPTVDA